jgi:hypothetical protein
VSNIALTNVWRLKRRLLELWNVEAKALPVDDSEEVRYAKANFSIRRFFANTKYWKKSKNSQDVNTPDNEQRQGRRGDANAARSRTASGHIVSFVYVR